eukprot:COSAG04_NODE_16048_length_511_cov_1.213592_1_plen_111_part_10
MSSKKAAKKKKKKKTESSHGAPANKGATKLLAAAQQGDCAAIVRLLRGGQLDINAFSDTVNQKGNKMRGNALGAAVGFQQEAATRLLLDRGANPNLATCSTGWTPLQIAAN